ncbi:C2 domain-containing protein 3 isoform X1 [Lepisosteus oculatus]|uniref:C2 domain-containing protein 3 isoform X1 n=1 Tax=Lepisosteus oculatus TaxID=7918 RepID=UPI0037175428
MRYNVGESGHKMKNKKLKSARLGSKRKKAPSDVSPSTSLPPLVEGQLRCFLRVTVSRILWTIPKPPLAPRVRLRWWGESSDGTCFRPRDSSQTEQRGVKTTARFAIRCGPKQFTSYLTDMGALVLEVLTKPDHLPVGRVQINGIARLSPSHSISGFFTLVSPTSEKLGEIQVSLSLEPLSETYDSSSSVPTTDVSIDAAMSSVSSRSKAVSQENLLVIPSLPRRLSVNSNSGKESAGSSVANTPRGKDHLYFQERTENQKETSFPSTRPERPEDGLRSLRLPSHHHQAEQGPSTEPQGQTASDSRPEAHNKQASSQASKDILSVLLDRGSKLRDAMVVSALKSDLDCEPALKDIPLPVFKDNIDTPAPRLPSSGNLLQKLLHSDPGLLPAQNNLLLSPEYPEQDCTADTENRAIELLLGSVNGTPLRYWDGTGSPPESLSENSSIFGDSELNDPHYDQSLLENLFYKTPRSDTSLSDFGSEDNEKQSVKRELKTRDVIGLNEEQQLRHSHGASSGLRKSSRNKHSSVLEEARPTAVREKSRSATLSMDQITLLGRIHLARVVIHTLGIPPDSTHTTPRQTAGKGRPPRPLTTRKCTYFVEYLFPVTSSRGQAGQISMATEVTRVASSKITGGVVKFEQRFVFPVQFSGATIERWSNMDLAFKIYSRKSSQRKPFPIGIAHFPLWKLLQSEELSLSAELSVSALDGETEKQDLGPLKVSFELAADNKDFSSAHARVTGASKTTLNAVTSPGKKAVPQHFNSSSQQQGPDEPKCNTSVHITESTEVEVSRPDTIAEVPTKSGIQQPVPCHAPPIYNLKDQRNRSFEEEGGLLLHVLLMVPNGKDFKVGPMQSCNVYLNCKLFGCDETTRSPVIWGQNQPTFNFTQVAPVTLTFRLLKRMRNNVMVIEVWQKVSSPGQDLLLGLVKLPLHQFYMSFRDAKIANLLLQAQYPVVGVDSYMPVMNVFTGNIQGSLRVLLAMGLAEQIAALQRLRDEELTSVPQPQRPLHSLDPMPNAEPKVSGAHEDLIREHVFEITVERVKGLTPLQSTVWGEADCYVQYSFPTQDTDTPGSLDSQVVESGVGMKLFRTATTLCVPDPVFSHSLKHSLLVPAGVPVQRLLLSACSRQGLDGGGGIHFEVWCRYYYPNVRDQVVARGVLPLSKLCAMVTMQREEQAGAQVFSLPLVPRTEPAPGHQPNPSGLLDVCILYKHGPVKTDCVREEAVASRVVFLAVQVHRAAGLKAAARAVAKRDGSFQYYMDVGVNTYVTIQLAFFPESERRSTRVVARSFCPEFDHHTEFPCSLQSRRASGETCSLAELLESAQVLFTVCHRDSRKAMAHRISKDTVLGTVKVQLAELIHKKTGISGWFALTVSQDPASSEMLQSTGGGLEISVSFAHHSDRERVLGAARALGWAPGEDGEGESGSSEEWEDGEEAVSIAVSVPVVWLPLHCLLPAGRRDLDRSTYCYFRYKLYDREAFCSPLRHPSPEEDGDGVVSVTFPGNRAVGLRSSQPLRWYLREEKLEVQVWVAFGKEKRPRPHDADRLVGSAHVDLSRLARGTRRQLAISGVYPLFKRTAPDLAGAALRVHIALTPASSSDRPEPATPGGQSGAEDGSDEEEPAGVQDSHQPREDSRHERRPSLVAEPPSSQASEVDLENTFAVTITVERAMHLSLKGSPLVECSGVKPSCCVSYATADAANPVTTQVVSDSDCPMWDHQVQTRLSKEILVDPQQTLVFKVWHKGDVERVVGFASVDLSPLLSGFQCVCGWYNVTDFNGQCQGQLKVSISPLETVQDLREQRLAASKGNTKESKAALQGSALSYRTSAMYSAFPTHITRYPEQLVNTFPEQADFLVSESRHEKHMENVRRFHQSLQHEQRNLHSAPSSETQPSQSSLVSALRKNLSELDEIQRYFSRKLSSQTFPSISDSGTLSRRDENVDPTTENNRDSHVTDSTHLLAKSSRLVGEVNNLLSGLHERDMDVLSDQAPHLPQGSSWLVGSAQDCTSPIEKCESHERDFLLPNVADDMNHTVKSSPPASLTADVPDETSSQEKICPVNAEEEKDSSSDHDHSEGDGFASGSHSEDEYEETVVQPRPLNDVTAMTDKTSPWSSLLSEADMASVEEVENWPGQEHLEKESDSSRQEYMRADGSPLPDILHDGHSSMPGSARTAESQSVGDCVRTAEQKDSDEFEDGATFRLNETEGDSQKQENREDAESSEHVRLDFSSDAEDPPDRRKGTQASESCERNEDSGDEVMRLPNISEHLQDTLDRSGSGEAAFRSKDEKESPTKLSDSVLIPNFFLPAQHLETSMRALHIAPIYPSTSSEPAQRCAQHGIPFRRAARLRPSIPSASKKKEETKRIAKIFAAQFTEKK